MAKLMACSIFTFSLFILACFSPPPTGPTFFKTQYLELPDEQRIESYNTVSEKFFFDNLTSGNDLFMDIDDYSKSLIAVRLFYVLGLENLSIPEKRDITEAIFNRIPESNKTVVIGNLVIPNWFTAGKPLIVSFTKIRKWPKESKIVAITNTLPLLKTTNPQFVKNTPMQLVGYPEVVNRDADNYYLGGDSFEFAIDENKLHLDAFFQHDDKDDIDKLLRDFDRQIMAGDLVGADAAKTAVETQLGDENFPEKHRLWVEKGMQETILLAQELMWGYDE